MIQEMLRYVFYFRILLLSIGHLSDMPYLCLPNLIYFYQNHCRLWNCHAFCQCH